MGGNTPSPRTLDWRGKRNYTAPLNDVRTRNHCMTRPITHLQDPWFLSKPKPSKRWNLLKVNYVRREYFSTSNNNVGFYGSVFSAFVVVNVVSKKIESYLTFASFILRVSSLGLTKNWSIYSWNMIDDFLPLERVRQSGFWWSTVSSSQSLKSET